MTKIAAPASPNITPGPAPAGYAYDLTLDPAARTLAGSGRITVVNSQPEPLGEVYLRLWANNPLLASKGGEATVSAVTVDGKTVAATQDRTVVKVPLAHPLAAGEQATIDFATSVRVPSVFHRTGRHRDGTLYFGNALPVLAVRDGEGWNLDPYVDGGESFYNLASPWSVTLHAPEAKQLITTGSATSDTVRDGVRTATFTAPAVRDFMVVAAEGYERLEQQVDGTSVRVWAPAADAGQARKMLAAGVDSLRFFNQRYGRYDMPEMDIVAARGLGGGMEYPGVTLNDQANSDGFLKTVVAHENAHQWWYGMAGNNQFDDPWLDESFASFVTSEFTGRPLHEIAQALTPNKGSHKTLQPIRGERPSRPGTAPVEGTNVSSPMSVLNGRGYYGTIYQAGARVLADLKGELGEERFLTGMRTWFEGNRHGVATTAGFIATMSDAAGRDLAPWFAQRRVLASEPEADRKLDPNGAM